MIRYNHIGYRCNAPKFFLINNPEEEVFCIQTLDESLVWKDYYTGTLTKENDIYKGDFSCIQAPADYRICCGTQRSYNFVIKDNPYGLLERLVTNFFVWQRCGSKKGWAGLCHQELDNLAGTGKKLDMRGGYHQSGDLRCWHDGCSSALYGYMRYAEEGKPVWEDGLFDEELRWGVDYFRKTVSPEGFIYDCQFVPLGWGPRDYYDSPAPLSDHYNILRLLARSSLYFREKEPAYAAENLALAEKVWEYVEKSDFFDTPYVPPVKDLPRGTQGEIFYWQNRKNCAGMDCASSAAAYDLYLATGKEVYFERTCSDMKKVIACQITKGEASGLFLDTPESQTTAFHDCSYGHLHSHMVFLADLILSQKNAPEIQEWKDALERYCDMLIREFYYVGLASDMPIPYGLNFLKDLPKAPAFTDSPIPLVHYTAPSTTKSVFYSLVLSMAFEIFGKEEYRFYAQRCLDYLLGNNKLAASAVTGVGYNHPIHNVYGQFFPSTPQLPGGVIHYFPGEYDLPGAGLLLRLLPKFRD